MLRSTVYMLLAAAAVHGSAATPEDFFRAIRSGDQAELARCIETGGINQADSRGTTPLHYAAAFGSLDSVKLLVARGADVNARNSIDATPLILAASTPAKIRVLLGAGADPRARTKAGRTALIIAAGRTGATGAVRRLLDAGAEVNVADTRGTTAILAASAYGDTDTVRLLIARGADPKTADKAGFTTLQGAVMANDIERVRLLLAQGVDVNSANTFYESVRHGKLALTGMTPLILAAPHGSLDMTRALLSAGANVNAEDGRGITPLMGAVATENQDANLIKHLLAAGADVNAKNSAGESVLDWARKYGNPTAVRLLQNSNANGTPLAPGPERNAAPSAPAEAVRQAVSLLQRSSTEFFRQSGCIGCHHQPSVARAELAAKSAGLNVAPTGAEEQIKTMTTMRPFEPALLQFMDPGGEVDTIGYALLGSAAAGMAANSLTDAAVSYIAGKQARNGAWTAFGISRPPFEDSNITRTALAIHALRHYGWPARQSEFDERIRRARAWLLKAEPATSYERADLLMALHWAGAGESDLARVAAGLMREQRPDGGFSQNRHLASDAYATGLALHALHESGQLRASDASYRRGVNFLLKTQLVDGSWYVRSRAPKFQPYFESGFPHAHDQWISSTATAYAVMALAPAAGAQLTASAQ